ncbi:hypothetical protein [Halalkalicoccus tibetensis]|uniref:Uncharacterized protein n=1 Tax=Halalkalicoccus tibetensis TaxID=175632 RepID=A0ABD5V6A6_9EURY
MEREYEEKKVEVEYNLCGEVRTARYIMEHRDDNRFVEFIYNIDHNGVAHLDYVKYDGKENEPAGTPMMILKYVELAKEAIVNVKGIEDVEPFLETIEDQVEWN